LSITESETTTPVVSFAERAAAFTRSRGYPPFQSVDLSGTPMRVREELVHRHGCDEGRFAGAWVYPGRTVIEVPGRTWPVARPQDCLDEPIAAVWFDAEGREVANPLDPDAPDGIVLLCPRCGLDCT
jgi:hypothetical protein